VVGWAVHVENVCLSEVRNENPIASHRCSRALGRRKPFTGNGAGAEVVRRQHFAWHLSTHGPWFSECRLDDHAVVNAVGKTDGYQNPCARDDALLPCDGGAELLLSALPSAAHCRITAAHARALQAMTNTPRLKQYLGEMIAGYEGRAADIEASGEAIAARFR